MNALDNNDERVMALVNAARARPEAEREAFLRQQCGGNKELFVEVWECVEWEEKLGSFLVNPVLPARAGREMDRPFESGDLLDRRFRILREVAQGGMGIVYEAFDEKLKRRIALKCAKLEFQRQLPREVRAATEVSHPNVCKLYEIHTAKTRHGEIDFLTMEFLDGDTLSARLLRGPIPEPAARDIARQICAGLAEAHRIGVIHGDLKPKNVILVENDDAIRAVVTDFGLAHRVDAQAGTTFAGQAGGTQGYMAPELLQGAKLSVASDIYALGVMFAELAAASLPEERPKPVADDATTVTLTRQTTWRLDPAAKSIAVNPKWDPVLARCLELNPAKRFQTVLELDRALAPSPTGRRVLMAAGVAALVMLAAALAYWQATAPTKSVTLAIDAGSFQSAAAISIARIQGDRSTRFQVTGELGRATHVLTVGNHDAGGQREIEAKLQDAKTGVILRTWRAKYIDEARRTACAADALAGVVTGTFELPGLPGKTTDIALDTAAQLLLRPSGADKALAVLATIPAPNNAEPYFYAVQAEAQWSKYFQTQDKEWLSRATESVRQAEACQPDLAPVRRIAGMLKYAGGRYEQAAADYRRAIQLDPRNGDAYRRLGGAYEANNQLSEARAMYQKALEIAPTDYRNYQQVGAFEDSQGNYEIAVKHFEEAVRLAPDESAPLRALGNEYLAVGRIADAEKQLRLSLQLTESASALNSLGVALMQQAEDDKAIPYLQRALAIGRPRPLWLMNLSIALRRSGRLGESQAVIQRGIALAEDTLTANPRDAVTRSILADLLARAGDRSRAMSEISQALQPAASQPAPVDASTLFQAICTYEALGRREDSLVMLRDGSRAVLLQIKNWPDLADLSKDERFLKLIDSRGNKYERK